MKNLRTKLNYALCTKGHKQKNSNNFVKYDVMKIMKKNSFFKTISVIIIWVVILLISVMLAFIFNGGMFWLRVVIALPFVYSAILFTKKTYND